MAMRHATAWLMLAALTVPAAAGQEVDAKKAEAPAPAPPLFPKPKVSLAFNRLYDYPELVEAMRALVAGHPDLLTMHSLGKSVEGRDLWAITVNDPKTGSDRSKGAMYVDGNIHGNEIQGAEACLYLVWYLAENRARIPGLAELTAERAFYVVPTVNPDGRAFWFNAPNTTHSSRSGKSPVDDDRDGLFDEDGYDDINGDGQVTQMRRKNPHGPYKISAEDRRLLTPIRRGEDVPAGERYELFMEGLDNDGDGLVNEDPPGGYDMNRNWPADWQPNHIQAGAGDYPLCWPETRATARFVLDHPNIAGVQAFHNAAGMILRGPGHSSRQAEYPRGDDAAAAEIGRVGERMIPFYKSLVIHKDLYNVHGGFINWTYEHLGIVSFTNELWNNDQLLGRPDPAASTNLGRAIGGTDEAAQLFASDRLSAGSQFVPWTPVKHPLYGDVEVGGFVKESQRVPPPFMIEEVCHRNAAFVAYHASQMPRVAIEGVKVEPLGKAGGTFSVTATLHNTRLIPSVTEQAATHQAGRPDTLTLDGPGLTVVASGVLTNPDTGEVNPGDPERSAATVRLGAGVPGEGVVRVRWFVRGTGEARVRYVSQKSKTQETSVPVR